MTDLTVHYYPETMHVSFITNAPAVFSALWSLAKPMMHPRTVKKYIICNSDYQETLYKYIPVQNLPVWVHSPIPRRWYLVEFAPVMRTVFVA